MVFRPPPTSEDLPDIPDSVPIGDFVLEEQYGRRPLTESLNPFTCGLTGKTFTVQQQKDRVTCLARALGEHLRWKVDSGTEFDKTAVIFAYNTIDILPISWAIHRLNGLSSPANPAYNVDELVFQLNSVKAKVVFTVLSLLPTALEAAARCNLPKDRVFICEMPGDGPYPEGFRVLSQLLKEGETLPELEPVKWAKGQAARQTAFISYSSGTSGLPKGVMISHYNVIANILQLELYERVDRSQIAPGYRDVTLGLMPFSHIYGLVAICHIAVYRGDSVVVLPKFDFRQLLASVAKFRVNTLPVVPPIIIRMVQEKQLCDRFDLTSVRQVMTGAAPLGKETAKALAAQHEGWLIRQGYGLTETATIVTSTSPGDVWLGSSGCLVPGYEAKLMSPEGVEIAGYNQPGELFLKSPSVVLGYLDNETATKETFVDMPEGRFLRTGDEAEIRVSPKGAEHIWVVDRIKELIKVKGLQVAPAELEACLLEHPAVADSAVIPVHDDRAGEVPKAFVVKSPDVGAGADAATRRSILEHVQKAKAPHKWLAGGVEFTDMIPKSASGKILRRLLRDREREKRRRTGARI